MRLDVFDESNRKRPAPVDAADILDPAKRQRMAANVPPPAMVVPPLPTGPVSYRQLFTLSPDANTAAFDVQIFKDPEQLLRILVPILQSIDATKLGNAINVRDYISSLAGLLLRSATGRCEAANRVYDALSRDLASTPSTGTPLPHILAFVFYLFDSHELPLIMLRRLSVLVISPSARPRQHPLHQHREPSRASMMRKSTNRTSSPRTPSKS